MMLSFDTEIFGNAMHIDEVRSWFDVFKKRNTIFK